MSGYCHRITSILPLFVCLSRSSWAIEHTFITFVEESKFDLILFDSRFPRQTGGAVSGNRRRAAQLKITGFLPKNDNFQIHFLTELFVRLQ